MRLNSSVVRCLHVNNDESSACTLPFALRNQDKFILDNQLLLGQLLFRLASSKGVYQLADLKQFFFRIWNYYDLPVWFDFSKGRYYGGLWE
jgi:hypothetical protein